MTKKQLLAELDATLSELLQLVASIDDDRLNAVPFPGSWTAGQVARHLVLSNGGFLKILSGPVKDTTRPFNAGVETIRRTLLDFSARLTAPAFVEPPATSYHKEDLLTALQEIKTGILNTAQATDLTPTCIAFELPRLGYLTRWEALHFVLYHTQRHIRQLRSIRHHLALENMSGE